MAAERNASRISVGLRFCFGLRECAYSMFFIHLLLGYGVVLLVAYLFQYRLLYLPEEITIEQVSQRAHAFGLKLWPREAAEYCGLISADPAFTGRGTVMVFHGNAGSALDRTYYVNALVRLGYRVILMEYPGYGGRSGKLGEGSFVTDARLSVERLAKEFGRPLYLWGESLGCGVATGVTIGAESHVDGVILLTPWDTLANTAQAHYWYLPARWLTKDRYDNVENLKHFSGPVAVVMAERDEVIPKRLTMRLYDSLPGNKQLWVFRGAGHNSWPMAPELGWWADVMRFVSIDQRAQDGALPP